jgi:pimeloyl-ACP methyl ester carboxylesterase
MQSWLASVPEPDGRLDPDGFMVAGGLGDRVHFLDWDARPGALDDRPTVIALHGIAQTAWIWAPIGRRLGGGVGGVRFVTPDLRGHGLSDAPTDPGSYELAVLAEDVVAVADGVATGGGVLLVGHGFGAIVAATAATVLGDRCAGLVLVDGGWERLETATGLDVEEFLRGLDEPPEVLASIDAFLADRRGFDPASWDADQERAARATVVVTHAGRVVSSARPHAIEACVRSMFEYEPRDVLVSVSAPVVALIGADDPSGSRAAALDEVGTARVAAGRDPIEAVRLHGAGHNLMRYRPREVSAAILAAVRR